MPYPTLNDALCSRNLLHTWDISYPDIGCNQTFSYTYDDGSKYGLYVSIYRTEKGLYETPISYQR